MPPRQPFVCRFLVPALTAAWCVLAILPAEAGWFDRREQEPEVPPPGNLAVSDLSVHEVHAPGALPRFLLRASVTNAGAADRAQPFRVIFRSSRGEGLGVCEGEALESGGTRLCEIWAQVETPHEVTGFEAVLDSDFGEMSAFDGIVEDDRSETSLAKRSSVPRIERFDVVPRVLQGMGEVRYEFSVERGHLAWILMEGREPRLVAGHPADGLLDGRGRLKIRNSGPVTIVVRDMAGSYVYATIPVTNLHKAAEARWATEASAGKESRRRDTTLPRVAARPLPEDPTAGDRVVLDSLVDYLAKRRWAGVRPADRPELAPRPRPKPANALNPKRD